MHTQEAAEIRRRVGNQLGSGPHGRARCGQQVGSGAHNLANCSGSTKSNVSSADGPSSLEADAVAVSARAATSSHVVVATSLCWLGICRSTSQDSTRARARSRAQPARKAQGERGSVGRWRGWQGRAAPLGHRDEHERQLVWRVAVAPRELLCTHPYIVVKRDIYILWVHGD